MHKLKASASSLTSTDQKAPKYPKVN